jgi:fibronectin type 3 domain-containing protein
MPVTSGTTAEFSVNRTINYEKDPPPGDWKNKALLLGAISNYQNEDGEGWYKTDDAKEQEWVKNNLLGEYDVITMYEKSGLSPSTYTCTYPLTQNNVQTSLSSGCWIMSTASHGSVQDTDRKIWDWDDWDGVPEYYEMSWIPFIDATAMTLSNSEQLPQVYMDACLNGKFDDTSSDCVAEWLVKLNGGGAIGVTAASRISYYCVGWGKGSPWNQELLCLFWQKFFNATNGYRPGKALYESKLAYYLEGFDMTDCGSKKDLLIYNLLGDPDLRRTVTYTQPEISILSPENTTYTTSTVPLTFTITKTASWIGYSLDSQVNVTIIGNTTITSLSEGTHNVTVYANDTAGNMGSSDIVYFTVNPPKQFSFDFGTASSPVETGYTRITSSTLYSVSFGYGWNSSTGLYSRDRGSPDDLRRDFVFSSMNRTFRVDLPNGTYLVMVVIGDQYFLHDNISIYAEDALKATVSTKAGEFVQKVFVVSVADGTLDLMFHDSGGSDSNWVINALLIEQYTERKFDFGTDGSPVQPGYTQVLPSTSYSGSTGFGWANTADLYARDRGAPDSLRRDFVFSASNTTFKIDLPNGRYMVVMIIGDNSYSHDRIDIYCEGALVVNDLSVEKGYFAEVTFLAEVSDGQLEIMFCDDGGANPHWLVNSIYVKTTFDLRLEFDFGTSSSPVEDGCVRVTPTTTYSSATSYGWSNVTNLDSRDRGAPDALRSDFVFSSFDRTFNVDLPNGHYQVTLIVGDQNYMHDKMDIYIEGVMVAHNITVPAGTFTEITFTVTVSDGQLNITFHDDGGSDANWVINVIIVDSYQNS